MLYTAQYRYPGPDRLDITVKGQNMIGKWFAPTWDMVMGVKNKTTTEQQYTDLYFEHLLRNWMNYPEAKEATELVVKRATEGDVTFVCFCPAGAFCHRHLLVRWFNHNYNLKYGGEKS